MSDKLTEFESALIDKLREKYQGIGQNFSDYLQGLIVADGLHYWDYIHVDALLGLQMPKTPYKDEIIFITYHQICELYFKLVKLEIEQLTNIKNEEYLNPDNWIKRLSRMVNYFKHLTNSFDIMKSGMDREDFKKFRMALLPASGFQAAQFRHIEIMSTNLNALLSKGENDEIDPKEMRDVPLEHLYEHIYWKKGGLDSTTKAKVLTLVEFEKKYDSEFMHMIKDYKFKNIAYLFYRAEESIKENELIQELLRSYDEYVNVYWKMGHLMASGRHLPAAEKGTGGTNWRKYLPPREQKVFFYETLWTEEEKEDWGKAAIMKVFREKIEKGWMKPE